MQNIHSPLLEQCLPLIKSLPSRLPILDLACGSGRNGLFYLKQQLPVFFADINHDTLAKLKQLVEREQSQFAASLATFWPVDFEQAGSASLCEHQFAAIMVFRYLHRPLMEQIKRAIIPGGVIIYETFTRAQVEFGRPKNPSFLLKAGELAQCFENWQQLHYFEGIKQFGKTGNKQAIAQIVARKPPR